MFSQILCPIDFSDASQHAIRYAIALARIQRARLTALYVYPPPFVPPDVPVLDAQAQADDLTRLETETAAVFQEATERGLTVNVVVKRGQPAREILMHAASLPADVIVMGTHGAGGFEHLVLGSVAEKVLRKATCPVLTVPPHAAFTDGPSFARLVCAIDFSEWSLAGLEEACALAGEVQGTVTAVHVIEWPWNEPDKPDLEGLPPAQAAALREYRRYQETMARTRLEQVTGEVNRGRCRVGTRIANGKSYQELLCAAEREHADLIVMGVHGRSALDVFVFGSTTHQVVRRATCPVLTLRH